MKIQLDEPLVPQSDTADLISDPRVKYSWFMQRSTMSDLKIDVESVWEDYTGEGVKIGVIDTQIDFRHEELDQAYDTSLDYNFADGTDAVDPSTDISDSHGTKVAGVISSEGGNGVGGTGIAPGATLVGFALDYTSSDAVSQALAGLRASVNVDVVNNSWSFTDNFADNFQDRGNAEMAQTLQYVAENGRDGLGTTMVFSAGNMGKYGSSNYHNFQNSPYTIAVGAVEKDGTASSFTSLGSNVLISAAGSDVLTTTIDGGYTKVDGTSFSAPAVSAVVGLMLEANEDLGYRDVQQILALSASREGLSDDPMHGNGWVTNSAETYNGGGMHYSDAFGYGFLNAHDAVRLAETWTLQQTAANRASETVTGDVGQYIVAGENDHLSFDIEVVSEMRVEHVELSMDLRWYYAADMDIYLTSPEGTSVQLVYDLPYLQNATIRDFSLSSVGAMGEMAQGTWTVDLYNRNPNHTLSDGTPRSGLLDDFTFKLHGSTDSLQNDTYVYTDEFGVIYEGADLARRSRLTDTDGGIDTINAAAVTGDSRIDLSNAGKTTIAGVTLDLDGDEIENIFAGDGNDELIGNDADNWLRGGRGNDILHYTAGADTIEGGAGTDTAMFDGLLASVSGTLTEAGTFIIDFLGRGFSLFRNVEIYAFQDVVMNAADFAAYLVSGGSEITPEPTPEPAPEPEPSPEPTPEPEPEPEPETTLYGSSSNDRMRGSDIDEAIHGGEGNDYVISYGGNDWLYGGDGVDTLKGCEGDDFLDGGAGDDYLAGGLGADRLKGGAGDDGLFGREGDDILQGGLGSDKLKGGDGADTFVFDISEIDAVDFILDFSRKEGDRILITGLSDDAGTDFHLVSEGRSVYLEIANADQTLRVAEILGSGLDGLVSDQLGENSLLLC